jgi:hypothetical protein
MSNGRIIGSVPQELRHVMEWPLPSEGVTAWGGKSNVRSLSIPLVTEQDGGYRYVCTPERTSVPTNPHKAYARLAQTVARLGCLGALSENKGIMAAIIQGPAGELALGMKLKSSMHADAITDPNYARLIASCRLGTPYETDTGLRNARDFEILKIDGTSMHGSQAEPADTIRTLLQITVFSFEPHQLISRMPVGNTLRVGLNGSQGPIPRHFVV